MPRLKWTRERIILQLRRLNRRNEVLTVHRMRAIGLGGMATTAYKLFGSWEAALRNAGIDPTAHRLRVPWTFERILDGVRQLAGETDALSRRRAEEACPALVRAVTRHPRLGSWRSALEAAGLNPGDHMRRRRWSAEAIVAEIRRIATDGGSLVGARIRTAHPALFAAACSPRHFGSWGQAVAAAGVAGQASTRRPPWTRQRIIDTLKALHARGFPLSTTWLRTHGWASLTAAAVRPGMFASWRDALECAGIDYDAVRKRAALPADHSGAAERVDPDG
jgi:hypothetical protein